MSGQWYYDDKGTQRGPLEKGDLQLLLTNGVIGRDTRVWNAKLGQEWKQAAQTELLADGVSLPPPLLPTQQALPDAAGNVDRFANWLAYLPLIIAGADVFLLLIGIDPNVPPAGTGVILWSVILTFWLGYKDTQVIAEQGLNPQKRVILPFLLLTQLGYFWRRAAVTGRSYKFIGIWLLSALGALIVEVLFVLQPA